MLCFERKEYSENRMIFIYVSCKVKTTIRKLETTLLRK